jgi:hypothetical protein
MRLVAGSNPAARTTLMKNLIKTMRDFFNRLFNRKQHWEDVLGDYSDYDCDWEDTTDPMIYVYELEVPQPDNVIYATDRFRQGRSEGE